MVEIALSLYGYPCPSDIFVKIKYRVLLYLYLLCIYIGIMYLNLISCIYSLCTYLVCIMMACILGNIVYWEYLLINL